MGINDLKLIDLRQIFKEKFDYTGKINIYKETEDKVFIYTEDYNHDLNLYYYSKESEELFHIVEIEDNIDRLELNYLDDFKIIYSINSFREDRFYVYEYDLITFEKELILESQDYDYIKALDSRYSLISSNENLTGERVAVLDTVYKKIHIIEDPRFLNSYLDNTRVVNIGGKDYLIHTRYNMDIYVAESLYGEGDYNPSTDLAGVYIIAYERFLYERILNKKQVAFQTLLESDQTSYINPLIYSNYKDYIDYGYNYDFYRIDYLKRKLELYSVRLSLGEVDKVLIDSVDLEELEDSSGLVIEGFPARILNVSSHELVTEYRELYPENRICSYIREKKGEREYLDQRIGNILITRVFQDKSDIEFLEYTRIRHSESMEKKMDIYGKTLVLEDRRSLLLYGDNSYRVYSRILESRKYDYYTDLRQVFKGLGNIEENFNFLISDFELAYEENKELDKIFYDGEGRYRDYIYLSGQDLRGILEKEDIQWIWGVISAFKPDYSREDVLNHRLPLSDGYSGFWSQSVNKQHPYSHFEIVAWDSSMTLFITEDSRLIDRFDQAFVEAMDLNYYNYLLESCLEKIENTLVAEGIIEDPGEDYSALSLSIFNNVFRKNLFTDQGINPSFSLRKEDILNSRIALK